MGTRRTMGLLALLNDWWMLEQEDSKEAQLPTSGPEQILITLANSNINNSLNYFLPD